MVSNAEKAYTPEISERAEKDMEGYSRIHGLSNLMTIAPHKDRYINRYDIDWLIAEAKNKTDLKYVAFWRAEDMFSQWYHGAPIYVNGRAYATAEQYMMSEKALLFGDVKTYQDIMNEPDPAKCKALGRLVTAFDKGVWDKAFREIVFHGNLAKLQSDIEIVDALLATGNAVLVEASPYDDIYGAGIGKEGLLDPNGVLKVPPWEWHKEGSSRQAQNHLGFVWMGLRDLFMEMIGRRSAFEGGAY